MRFQFASTQSRRQHLSSIPSQCCLYYRLCRRARAISADNYSQEAHRLPRSPPSPSNALVACWFWGYENKKQARNISCLLYACSCYAYTSNKLSCKQNPIAQRGTCVHCWYALFNDLCVPWHTKCGYACALDLHLKQKVHPQKRHTAHREKHYQLFVVTTYLLMAHASKQDAACAKLIHSEHFHRLALRAHHHRLSYQHHEYHDCYSVVVYLIEHVPAAVLQNELLIHL